MQQNPPQAYFVTVIEAPVQERTVGDVILESLGVAGVLLVLSLALGAVMAAVLVGWNKRHPPQLGHLPSISPFVPDPNGPPSSLTR